MFLKADLGYLSQVALRNMQLLVPVEDSMLKMNTIFTVFRKDHIIKAVK